jgi:pyrimidine-specific ribonucleoside hydrolase
MDKIILDCDPGHDDAFAIMLAVSHLEVLGITTVGGNSPLEKTTINALKILEVLGRRDIPVHAGHASPLVVPLVTAPMFHGESGLDGPVLPFPATPAAPGHAVDFIIDTAMATEGVTIVATGPLTNVAAALGREPRIAGRIRELSIMGGSATYGNWTPTAEFNIFVDPEAAWKVFESGLHIKMCGLNLTQQACITPREFERIAAVPTRAASFAADLLRFFMASSIKVAGIKGADIHDALAVAWLIDPSLIKAAPMHVTVELKGEYTRGMTVCDYRHLRSDDPRVDLARSVHYAPRGRKPNAEVGLELDFEGFMTLLLETLASLP